MGVAIELRDNALGGHSLTLNASGAPVLSTNGAAATLLPIYSEEARQTATVTIATTGNTDAYVIAPFAGRLSSVDFSGIDALATHDSNYITFSITNLGQAGAGTAAMLLATAANTTKITGGSALAANTKRALSLTATASDLVVAKGDRLLVRYAATGTLANTVTGAIASLTFTRTS